MDSWSDVRRKARECHRQALERSRGDRRAASIIAAALEIDDLEIRRIDLGKGTLGSLDRTALLVNLSPDQKPIDERVVIAHEIGHLHLHNDPHSEVTLSTGGLGGDPVDSGAGRVEGYSARERKEQQADVFAGEFLCPAEWLKEEYLRGKRPSDIAAELELPFNLVMNQMVRALLLPPLSAPPTAAEPGPKIELDESQRIAATWSGGPLLVDAGPGTGKTRTLIHRIEHLLGNGTSPGEFLALTFSNKAAEEMRDRLSAMNADASIEMWVGTFHAFGLELIMKWPGQLGRTTKVRVIDQAGSLAILEDNLERLSLKHYQNLYEPAYELAHVLKVISRCKDELVSHEQLAAAATVDLRAAVGDDEIEKAERSLEIAEIYRIYEECLIERDAVDFGDCVRLANYLIRNNAAVKSYIAGFSQVLVDEYQDVNFASAEMLRAIHEAGASLWVVADGRQSIYRFRGAEPTNVTRFVGDFGGTRTALTNNYRSLGPVVRAFETFSASMGGGRSMSGTWNVQRLSRDGQTAEEVAMTVAPSVVAEAEAIKDKILELKERGVAFAGQTILARSHLTLSRITGVLESLGVPLLYLGDLFERQEVRDLLSLLALDAEHGAVGLPRVAALRDYAVPEDDSLRVIRWAKANNLAIYEALGRAAEVVDISPEGARGLAKLGSEVSGLENASPWTLLTSWLIDRSAYLQPLLTNNSPSAQQQLVAIYQVLKVCGEFAALGEKSRKKFLARIRRIEALNEDTAYRSISSEATEMDAVRVMTIHGSKGLEFEAVHLPALATGYMPGSWRGVRYVPPTGLERLAMDRDDHQAEEECLFFVALSRARDYLSLTRAETYKTRKAGESAFLPPLRLKAGRRAQASSDQGGARPLMPVPRQDVYPVSDLDIYLQCGRRYRYQIVDALRGGRDESPYVAFHRCVYETVNWVEEQVRSGQQVGADAAVKQLESIWEESGPLTHGFAGFYLNIAREMISRMAIIVASEPGSDQRVEWTVPLGANVISVRPDRVVKEGNTVRVQRVRTGRKTKSEPEKPIYSILRRGAEINHPGKKIEVETLYLSTGERVPSSSKTDAKNLKEYETVISSIEAGDFGTENADRRYCPNCPYYFRCTG
ncbi:UvrD-helicase domain-containing protein [Rhizobium sp. CNPSo 3490]|uniref:UvrD-helicase domain-containing protein n=1 Tax=Rhizobium sp. CNPSo 3490 TaxID=3021407 RepID=UPI002550D57A|nr:UvrD-helicase domain-containing protein [Rhizobium sp. CNPSo 3490]MDK4732020.1 UvrD-helicase domain-containing protein [Rhizobium sp. CNPSo 3490]